jgi:Outer membrane protein beta-barrel domain
MKKQCIVPILLLFCLQMNAQMHFGIKGGFNNSSAIYGPKAQVIYQSNAAFQFGVTGEMAIKRSFLLKAGLLFNQKGNFGDNSKMSPDRYQRSTFRLNYLETDIVFAYKIKLGKNIHINAGVGPFIGIGLFGTEKGKDYTLGNPQAIDRKIVFSNNKKSTPSQTYFKSIDFGLNFNTSVSYKKYFLYLNFGKGLVDRVSSDSPDWNSRNEVFTMGLGYYFK